MEEEIEKVVREYGWYVVNIADHSPPFLYTIGLMQTFEHPEFILYGLDSENAYALLSGLVGEIRNGRSFGEPGVQTVVLDNTEHRVGFRRVHNSRHPQYLGGAMGYCRYIGKIGMLEAMQVFWPDQAGRFPFDAGFDSRLSDLQPRIDIGPTEQELRRWERQWE
jgi:hypothetical protein